MEDIQRIREIVESKLEHFSDGEYLELMNSLMSLSKKISTEEDEEEEYDFPAIAPEAEEESDSESEEEEYDFPIIAPEAEEESDSEEEEDPFVFFGALYQVSDPVPIRGPYDKETISNGVRVFLDKVDSTTNTELKMRYSICLYAYLFSNYSFIEDSPRFKGKLVEMLHDLLLSARHLLERLGKLEIMEQRLQILQS